MASFSTAVFTPDRLIAGEEHILSRKVTILSGQNLVRGAVLGKITSGGKYVLSLSAAVDGSETPDAILAMDTDASAADKEAMAYFAGRFNESALTLGASHTVASIREGLRLKGIYLVSVQPA